MEDIDPLNKASFKRGRSRVYEGRRSLMNRCNPQCSKTCSPTAEALNLNPKP